MRSIFLPSLLWFQNSRLSMDSFIFFSFFHHSLIFVYSIAVFVLFRSSLILFFFSFLSYRFISNGFAHTYGIRHIRSDRIIAFEGEQIDTSDFHSIFISLYIYTLFSTVLICGRMNVQSKTERKKKKCIAFHRFFVVVVVVERIVIIICVCYIMYLYWC